MFDIVAAYQYEAAAAIDTGVLDDVQSALTRLAKNPAAVAVEIAAKKPSAADD